MAGDATTNLGALFDPVARYAPGRTAMIDGASGESTTYGGLVGRVGRVGNALGSLGVEPGERLALCYPNDRRFVAAFFGALRLGAVPVPVNVKQPVETLGTVLADAGASRLLLGPAAQMRDTVADAATTAGLAPQLLLHGGGSEFDSPFETVPFDTRVREASSTLEPAPVAPDDPAIQLYTSGSTGRPKGVVISHGGARWNTRVFRQVNLLDEDERMLIVTPMFHKVATVNMKASLAAGGSFVLMPAFDPETAIAAIEDHHVTFLTGVPAVYRGYVGAEAALATHDVSSVAVGICGGDALPTDLHDAFGAAFDAPLLENYGLSEGGPMVASTPRWGVKKRGSCGLPLPDVTVRIVDPNGTEALAPGSVGELLVTSPGMASYHDRPEVTARAFVTLDGTRFLRTGDLAQVDADGYLSIEGRVDDMFIVGGENLYPVEVETLLAAHEAVSEVVVVPVPHAVKGRAPVAFVVADGDLTGAALKQFALDRGPAYAHPRRVFFVESFPLTGTNKVDREALEHEALDRIGGSL